jgi:Ca2+-transporting ATPase
MSTILENIQTENGYNKRVHLKGSSDIVAGCCSHYLDENGKSQPMTNEVRNELNTVTLEYGSRALRAICLAFKDLAPGEGGAQHKEPID